jgi:hypothetical protein
MKKGGLSNPLKGSGRVCISVYKARLPEERNLVFLSIEKVSGY